MNVFMINTLYYPIELGGTERVVKSLAESLVRAGHQVAVATASPGGGARSEVFNGVTVHYLGVSRFLWPYYPEANPRHLKLIWKGLDTLKTGMVQGLGRLLDREKPDVVHSHNLPGFSVSAWQAAKARGLPLVHNLHDYSLLCARSSMFKSGRNCGRPCGTCRLFSFSKRGPSSLVDAVVGVSRFVLDRHLEHGFFARTRQREVIFSSCEQPGRPPSRAGEARLPLRLGYLGRLQPSKGVEWVLQALQGLSPEPWELRLAGTGGAEYVSDLKRRFASPRVHFLGFIRPEALFAEIDLLLVPSLWQEPFGMIIIEAYAHGVPVIAANRGGIPEIVDEGRTGFIFNPESQESLRAAIRHYVEQPLLAARMRSLALEKAKCFSTARMVDSYLSVYERALQEWDSNPKPRT